MLFAVCSHGKNRNKDVTALKETNTPKEGGWIQIAMKLNHETHM